MVPTSLLTKLCLPAQVPSAKDEMTLHHLQGLHLGPTKDSKVSVPLPQAAM